MKQDVIVATVMLVCVGLMVWGAIAVKKSEIKERNDIRNQFILDSIKIRRKVEREYELQKMPDSLLIKILKQERGLK